MTEERRRDRELDGTAQRFDATCEVRAVEGSGRRLRFIASTERVGRDGDIIRAKGWDTKAFMKNPVFLWAHDPLQPPIGRVVKVEKVRGDAPRLEVDVEFAGPEEGHDFADTVYRLYRRGFLKAVSVGFMVRAYEKPTDEQKAELGLGPFGIVITNAELLELSAVPVPADPGALKITKDDREARADLLCLRGYLPEAEQGRIDDALGTEFKDTDQPAPSVITEETMREIVTDCLDAVIPRIADSVVRSMNESIESRGAAPKPEPREPTRQKDTTDLYGLRDAITTYMEKRKESH